MAGAAPLAAANGSLLEPTSPETVVVSASRVPVKLVEAGSSVTVITREEIERRDPQYLSDLLRSVPGLAVSANGGPGSFVQLRMRGGEANHVLVLIDGVEANDFTFADEFDFGTLTVSDIERVEIVRGSQSALWGSDAVSGVINIVTRNSESREEASVGAEVGAYGTERGEVSVGGTRGALKARLGLGYVESSGFNAASTGNEDEGFSNATGNFRLSWDAHEALRVTLNSRVTAARSEYDLAGDDGLLTDTEASYDYLQGYTGTRAELDTFGGHWRHVLKAGYTRLLTNYDGAAFPKTDGSKYAAGYQSSFLFDTALGLPASHELSLAVDYDVEFFEQRGNAIDYGIFGIDDPNQDRRRHTIGYVTEYRLTLAEVNTVSIGGRWDDNSDVKDLGTWRLALSRTFRATGTTLSASYATGQKRPTFTELFGYSNNPVNPFVGNPSLRAERSAGYDIGIRQALGDGHAWVSLTYFNQHLEDELNNEFFPVYTIVNLEGTSKRAGFELAGEARLTEHLGATASYTYLDATYMETATQRADEVRRPNHQASGSLFWQGFDDRLTLDVHLDHTGERGDDFFDPDVYAVRRVSLDPYTLVGISGAWRMSPRLRLTARVDNLLDDEYQDVFDYRTQGVGGFLGVKLDF
jgi:vitamin B12 transporter